MIAAIVGLSIVAFIVIIIAVASGVDIGAGVWPAVYVFPGIGLPVGFVMIIVLLIISTRRRSREAAAAQAEANPGTAAKPKK